MSRPLPQGWVGLVVAWPFWVVLLRGTRHSDRNTASEDAKFIAQRLRNAKGLSVNEVERAPYLDREGRRRLDPCWVHNRDGDAECLESRYAPPARSYRKERQFRVRFQHVHTGQRK